MIDRYEAASYRKFIEATELRNYVIIMQGHSVEFIKNQTICTCRKQYPVINLFTSIYIHKYSIRQSIHRNYIDLSHLVMTSLDGLLFQYIVYIT